MIRTQISLNDIEYTRAREEAGRQGISLAELVRRSLRAVLPAKGDRPWMKYAGDIESRDPQSSRKIDEIVYGQKE